MESPYTDGIRKDGYHVIDKIYEEWKNAGDPDVSPKQNAAFFCGLVAGAFLHENNTEKSAIQIGQLIQDYIEKKFPKP